MKPMTGLWTTILAAALLGTLPSIAQPESTAAGEAVRPTNVEKIDGISIDSIAPQPTRPQVGKLINWFSIGHSSTNDATRRLGWGIADRGWQQFIDRVVTPFPEVKDVGLHNGWGVGPDREMRWDQALEAAIFDATREDPIWGFDFTNSWGMWLDADPEHRLWIHIGAARPTWMKQPVDMEDTFLVRKIEQVIDLMMIRPEQQVFSMDAASSADEGSWAAYFVRKIEERGARTVIEARPLREHDWLKGRGTLFTQRFDQRIYEWPTSDKARWWNDEDLGDVVVLLNGHWDWDAFDLATYLSRGYYVGVYLNGMKASEREIGMALHVRDPQRLTEAIRQWNLEQQAAVGD